VYYSIQGDTDSSNTSWLTLQDLVKHFYSVSVVMTGGCFSSSISSTGSLDTNEGESCRAPWHVQRTRVHLTLAAPVNTQPKQQQQQQQQQQHAPTAGMYALSVYDTAAVTQVYVSLHQQDEACVNSESYVLLHLTVLRVGTGFTHEVVAQQGPTTARQIQVQFEAISFVPRRALQHKYRLPFAVVQLRSPTH
jgi:hypothetical protein